MIRVTRRFIRFMGWLLTPVVAWAAAFLGGRIGASLADFFESPKSGFLVMVATAGVFAAVATWMWAWAIRRSARLQAWSRRRWRQKRAERASQKDQKTVAPKNKITAHKKTRNVQRASGE